MKEKTGIKSEAYFGSVRFFRHIVYLCLFLIVVTPYLCIMVLFYQNKLLRSEVTTLRSKSSDICASPDVALLPEDRKIVSSSQYQKKYPDLYCTPRTPFVKREKTVYLTFDDGPSRHTDKILRILGKYNIKATFFAVGKNDPKSKKIMKQIVEEGHTLAPHSYTHVYNKIYSSVDSFLDDFKKINDLIYETTGVRPNILRFPGGTVNVYNRRIFRELSAEMLRRGYTFYDWDVSAADATKSATADSVMKSIICGVHEDRRNIVLMHDTSEKTLKALEKTIIYLKNMGFAFDRLTNEVEPVTFYYNYLEKGGV